MYTEDLGSVIQSRNVSGDTYRVTVQKENTKTSPRTSGVDHDTVDTTIC